MYRPAAQFRTAVQRSTPPLLVLMAMVVIVLGRADPGMFDSLRTTLTDDAGPLLSALSRPLGVATTAVDRVRGVIAMYQDNLYLRRDNARLLQWQQVALQLSADNRQLRGLLKVVPKHAVSYLTARVIADSGGGYVRSVLIDAGAQDGLVRGEAAITGEGLVGRLTEVGEQTARILLVTDLNSRIPVVIEGGHSRAVLAGDNSERPRLIYVTRPDRLKVGNRIVTSGEGGVFPPDLPVGIISAADADGARVEPFAELSQLGYALIVNYGLAGGLPQPVPVATRRPRDAIPRATDAAVVR
jgi:rod shape-determining protein MreC